MTREKDKLSVEREDKDIDGEFESKENEWRGKEKDKRKIVQNFLCTNNLISSLPSGFKFLVQEFENIISNKMKMLDFVLKIR